MDTSGRNIDIDKTVGWQKDITDNKLSELRIMGIYFTSTETLILEQIKTKGTTNQNSHVRTNLNTHDEDEEEMAKSSMGFRVLTNFTNKEATTEQKRELAVLVLKTWKVKKPEDKLHPCALRCGQDHPYGSLRYCPLVQSKATS